jgi:hypothetical protein
LYMFLFLFLCRKFCKMLQSNVTIHKPTKRIDMDWWCISPIKIVRLGVAYYYSKIAQNCIEKFSTSYGFVTTCAITIIITKILVETSTTERVYRPTWNWGARSVNQPMPTMNCTWTCASYPNMLVSSRCFDGLGIQGIVRVHQVDQVANSTIPPSATPDRISWTRLLLLGACWGRNTQTSKPMMYHDLP